MYRAVNPTPRHGLNVHDQLGGPGIVRTPIPREHDVRRFTAFVPPGMMVIRSFPLHVSGFAREKINDECTFQEALANPKTVFAVQALLCATSRATPCMPTLELDTIIGVSGQQFFVQLVLRTVVPADSALDENTFTDQAIRRLDGVHLIDRNVIITDAAACAELCQQSFALQAYGAVVSRMPQAHRHFYTDGLPHMPVRVCRWVEPPQLRG